MIGILCSEKKLWRELLGILCGELAGQADILNVLYSFRNFFRVKLLISMAAEMICCFLTMKTKEFSI
jgi:hypothetical protein